MALDGNPAPARAMFQMMGVFAEFERAMIRERVLAGLARARQVGTHLGRKFTEDTKEGSRKVKAVLAMRAKGIGYRKIAREVGLGDDQALVGVGATQYRIPERQFRSKIRQIYCVRTDNTRTARRVLRGICGLGTARKIYTPRELDVFPGRAAKRPGDAQSRARDDAAAPRYFVLATTAHKWRTLAFTTAVLHW
jgi:hypothetical protein